MKKLLIIFLLISCAKHQSKETINHLGEIVSERNIRLERFDPWSITRCDRITFFALLDAFGKRNDQVFDFEKPKGKWNRDVLPCYDTDLNEDGESDSRSETSRDGYISVLHASISRKDPSIAQRIIDWAEPQGWNTGIGSTGVQNIWYLSPTLYQMVGVQKLADSDDALPFLEGFRGHVIANYLLLRGRLNGALSALELKSSELLVSQYPENPYFSSIYHRFTDGDQSSTISLLKNFPTEESPFGWGSCPNDLYYILVSGVILGI